MRSLKKIALTVLLVSTCATTQVVFAQRLTDDRGADLVKSLVNQGRFEDARWICRRESERHGPGQLLYAQWVARSASVQAAESAESLYSKRPSEIAAHLDTAIEQSVEQIDALLDQYPDDVSVLFLKAERLGVIQTILRAAIVAASVAPEDEMLVDKLVQGVTRLQYESTQLVGEARDEWRRTSSRRTTNPAEGTKMVADQYERLSQELTVDQISIAILLTELFAPDSSDHRAAAAAAIRLAESAVQSLPDSVAAKSAARVLWAESLLRSGDFTKAEQVIRDQESAAGIDDSSVWTALKVRSAAAAGDSELAKRIAETFYKREANRSKPTSAPEVDFAYLDLLLDSDADNATVARWIDNIERRSGAFGRRRAEMIVLAALRTANGNAISKVSPALVAAQGEDFLRRNQPGRAASLLRQAALAETDPESALDDALKSAAAATANKDVDAAVEVLRTLARKHLRSERAPGVMMQAALLRADALRKLAAEDSPETGDQLRRLMEVLEEIYQTWPGSESAAKANEWMCNVFEQSGRFKEAASAALELLTLSRDVSRLPSVASRWFDYLSQSEADETTKQLGALTSSLQELARENETFVEAVAGVSVWLFDHADLTAEGKLDGQTAGDAVTAFLDRLRQFRTGQALDLDSGGIDPQWQQRVRWRLARDAYHDPGQQVAVGRVLLGWPGGDEWDEATAGLWAAPSEASVDAVRRLAVSGRPKSESLRRGMSVLKTSRDSYAKRVAVELADRLAGSLEIGSEPWFDAKLQAIRLLAESGMHDEASKRARYVLLLHKPKTPELTEQFERFADRK